MSLAHDYPEDRNVARAIRIAIVRELRDHGPAYVDNLTVFAERWATDNDELFDLTNRALAELLDNGDVTRDSYGLHTLNRVVVE